jgi:hypothetical protein
VQAQPRIENLHPERLLQIRDAAIFHKILMDVPPGNTLVPAGGLVYTFFVCFTALYAVEQTKIVRSSWRPADDMGSGA